jgi:nitrite reductase (NADH) large subunit
MGKLEPELEDDQVYQIIEDRKNAYRKLVIRGGELIGAMLVGNTQAAGTLVQLFDRGDPLPDDPLEVLCQTRPAQSSAERVVCNCHKLSEGTIVEAIRAGAESVEALGGATRAGTGCGSCKVQLAELVEKHAKGRALPVLATA